MAHLRDEDARSWRIAGRAIGVVVFVGAASCAHSPLVGDLPDGLTITHVASCDPRSPLAWDAPGRRIAFSDHGVMAVALDAGSASRLTSETPTALAFSPGGDHLAVATGEGPTAQLALLDDQGAGPTATLTGRVGWLAFEDGGALLATAARVEGYSFGGRVEQLLYRWDGAGEPVVTPLSESTLKRRTLQRSEGLVDRAAQASLSPLGDELVYGRLHDPPALPPYQQIVVRNMATGAEHEVADVDLAAAGALAAPDGETVVVADGKRLTRRIDPWTGREIASYPAAGRTLAVSPSGLSLLIDGVLYDGGRPLAVFTPETVGRFSPDGTALLLRSGGELYVVRGLAPSEAAAPLDEPTRARLFELRRWRSEGLITEEDYRAARQRLAAP